MTVWIWPVGIALLLAAGFAVGTLPRIRARRDARRSAWTLAHAAITSAEISRDAAAEENRSRRAAATHNGKRGHMAPPLMPGRQNSDSSRTPAGEADDVPDVTEHQPRDSYFPKFRAEMGSRKERPPRTAEATRTARPSLATDNSGASKSATEQQLAQATSLAAHPTGTDKPAPSTANPDELLARAVALAAHRGGRANAEAAARYAREADRIWRSVTGHA